MFVRAVFRVLSLVPYPVCFLLTLLVTKVTAVNGSLCKRVKKWVKTIPADHLQFFALQMPKEPWRELADVVHFAPQDFALDWYLGFVFGRDAPPDSLAVCGANINTQNVLSLVEKFHVPYSFLRKVLRR